MRLTADRCRARVAAARHGVLATVGPDGAPHAVPIVFAPDGEAGVDRLITAVDAKPKSTTSLRRLDNLRAEPRAAVLVERYAEDWSRLWWVRVDVVAEVLADGEVARAAAALLAERYPQYGGTPPAGPVIVLRAVRWTGWAFTADADPVDDAEQDHPGDRAERGGVPGGTDLS